MDLPSAPKPSDNTRRSRLARRAYALVSILTSLFSAVGTADAARVTDVADASDVFLLAGEERVDLLDLYFGTDTTFIWQRGTLQREPTENIAAARGCSETSQLGCRPVDELGWRRTTVVQTINAQLGIYRDLAVTFSLPIVLNDLTRFAYADGVSAANSSIAPADPSTGLFDPNYRVANKGLGNMSLGLRWAPFNDERHSYRPTWLLAASWQGPLTSSTHDPSQGFTDQQTGPVGDGVHRLIFEMALSKRMGNFGPIGIDPFYPRRGYLEPYIHLSYAAPIPDRSLALNDLVRRDNNPFGRAPGHQIHFDAGLEIIAYEHLLNGYKVGFDLGAETTFITQGRNYNIVTNALRELTLEQQHMILGGRLGVFAQLTPYFRLHANMGIQRISQHYLTFEEIGTDGNNDGQVLPPEQDTNAIKDNINPYYAPYDGVGQRLFLGSNIGYRLSIGFEVTL